jgi:hypothetical protein
MLLSGALPPVALLPCRKTAGYFAGDTYAQARDPVGYCQRCPLLWLRDGLVDHGAGTGGQWGQLNRVRSGCTGPGLPASLAEGHVGRSKGAVVVALALGYAVSPSPPRNKPHTHTTQHTPHTTDTNNTHAHAARTRAHTTGHWSSCAIMGHGTWGPKHEMHIGSFKSN